MLARTQFRYSDKKGNMLLLKCLLGFQDIFTHEMHSYLYLRYIYENIRIVWVVTETVCFFILPPPPAQDKVSSKQALDFLCSCSDLDLTITQPLLQKCHDYTHHYNVIMPSLYSAGMKPGPHPCQASTSIMEPHWQQWVWVYSTVFIAGLLICINNQFLFFSRKHSS